MMTHGLHHPHPFDKLRAYRNEGISEQILQLQEGHKEDILQLARSRSLTLGKQVQVSTPQQVFVGWAESIGEDGSLLLRMGDQSKRSILLGEIKHLREVPLAS